MEAMWLGLVRFLLWLALMATLTTCDRLGATCSARIRLGSCVDFDLAWVQCFDADLAWFGSVLPFLKVLRLVLEFWKQF